MAVEVFSTPGAGTWVSPITGSVEVACYAGGNGGQNGDGMGLNGGDGGGGGSRAKYTASVVEDTTYHYYVGNGGAIGANGENSWYGPTAMEVDAQCKAVAGVGRIGGAAASCVGDVKKSGGDGGVNDATNGGGGGGCAGVNADGGAGGTPTAGSAGSDNPFFMAGAGGAGGAGSNDGTAGLIYGGGGGGGGPSFNGAVGFKGAVRLEYTVTDDVALANARGWWNFMPHIALLGGFVKGFAAWSTSLASTAWNATSRTFKRISEHCTACFRRCVTCTRRSTHG